jgi:hypothetical protein
MGAPRGTSQIADLRSGMSEARALDAGQGGRVARSCHCSPPSTSRVCRTSRIALTSSGRTLLRATRLSHRSSLSSASTRTLRRSRCANGFLNAILTSGKAGCAAEKSEIGETFKQPRRRNSHRRFDQSAVGRNGGDAPSSPVRIRTGDRRKQKDHRIRARTKHPVSRTPEVGEGEQSRVAGGR